MFWARILLLVFLFASPLNASNSIVDIEVREFTLKNGMKVILWPRSNSPSLSAGIFFRSGWLHENIKQKGLCKLYEHVALGSASPDLRKEESKSASDFHSILSKNGAVNFHSEVGLSHTGYVIDLPPHRLELWAHVESNRLHHPELWKYKQGLESLREEEEWKNNLKAKQIMQTVWHAFSPTPLVNHIDKDALNFYRRQFHLNNAVAVLVGDFDLNKAEKIMKRYFGSLSSPSLKGFAQALQPNPKLGGARQIQMSSPSGPRLLMFLNRPESKSFNKSTYDVLKAVLGTGSGSRLYRQLITQRHLAHTLRVNLSNRFPVLQIDAMALPTHDSEELLAAINASLNLITKRSVSNQELKRARIFLQTQHHRSMQYNSDVALRIGRLETASDKKTEPKSWQKLKNYPYELTQVKTGDIKALLNHMLLNDKPTIVHIRPEGKV